MNFILSYILVFIASFFNAIMDGCENENFYESIFNKLPQNFWYKRESWKVAPKISGYKMDAWHLSKSAMIICLAAAIIVFRPKHEWWVHLISIGIIWNVGFWLFYHKIFRVK